MNESHLLNLLMKTVLISTEIGAECISHQQQLRFCQVTLHANPLLTCPVRASEWVVSCVFFWGGGSAVRAVSHPHSQHHLLAPNMCATSEQPVVGSVHVVWSSGSMSGRGVLLGQCVCVALQSS